VKIRCGNSIILPLILYRCDTWFLALREVDRLRKFKNVVVWRTFGPEREKVTGIRRGVASQSVLFTQYF
jgi:hypothetical protein